MLPTEGSVLWAVALEPVNSISQHGAAVPDDGHQRLPGISTTASQQQGFKGGRVLGRGRTGWGEGSNGLKTEMVTGSVAIS